MKLNVLRLRDKKYLRRAADEIKHAGAVGINCKYTYLSKALVEVMHERGLSVSVWTVDKKPLMLYVLSLAPDNITTRNPRLLMSLIKDFSSLRFSGRCFCAAYASLCRILPTVP